MTSRCTVDVMAHSEAVYELTKAAEEHLSADVWKWKLHALKRSRKALVQVIPMPTTQYLDLSPVSDVITPDYSDKVYVCW